MRCQECSAVHEMEARDMLSGDSLSTYEAMKATNCLKDQNH